MSSDTFILKHHSYILGKNKKIFAFRKLPDVGLIKKNLENKKEYTIERHREEVNNELGVRGYSEEVIAEWISYIE